MRSLKSWLKSLDLTLPKRIT